MFVRKVRFFHFIGEVFVVAAKLISLTSWETYKYLRPERLKLLADMCNVSRDWRNLNFRGE